MSFVYGAILWGSLAVAAPVLIHLLMRPHPRTEPLPTLRFLRRLQRKHFARLRWKHILLLALRMAAVLLIVLLLARAFFADYAGTGKGAPTALVVVLDTSASMGYRHQGRTVLQRGQQIAADLVESLPPESSAAVLCTSPQATADPFLPDCKLSAQHVRDALLGQDDAPLARAIASAEAMLRDRKEALRRILVVTDLTKQAWRDMSPFAPRKDIRVHVIDVGVQRAANVALQPPRTEADDVPLDSDVSVRSTLWSEHLGGAMRLGLFIDGRPVEQRSIDLQPGLAAAVTFTPRADHPGVLLGRLNLQNDDPLQADNVRYFTVDVSPPAEVLVVVADGGTNSTAFLLANAVAPPMPGLTGTRQRRTIRPDQLTAEALQTASLVILADTPAITDAQWKLLEDYCRKGQGLWIVPGDATQTSSYDTQDAQRIMPARIGRIETLSNATTFAAPDTTQPLLEPFAPGPDANPPLTDVLVERRFTVESVAADATMVLAYTDGTPAILTRGVGDGQVALWNLSPARGWSNLARLGGQFVVLAQRSARLLTGAAEPSRQFTPDQMIELALPREFHHPNATLQRQGDARQTSTTFSLTQSPRRSIRLAPQPVGNYTLTLTEADRTKFMGFSVNTPAGESDLSRLTVEDLNALFPDGVTLGDTIEEDASKDATILQRLDLSAPLFLALLAILLAETFLANRFHRLPEKPESDQK